MALYRATAKLINRIMTGRIPARAFVVGALTNDMGVVIGEIIGCASPGHKSVTNIIDGLQFRDQIDPSTGAFTMPAGMSPVTESLPNGFTGPQPTVRCEIRNSSDVHEKGSCHAPLAGGAPIFMNRYFEADFPAGVNGGWLSYMVQNGWFASAGALTNASVPAAVNIDLVSQTVRNGSRTGES